MIAMNPPKRPNLITVPVVACLLLFLLGGTSCVVTTVEKLAPDLSPRRVEEQKVWDVVEAGLPVGAVRLLTILDPRGPVTMYHVTHLDGQQAGWIDLHGRAFRDEPFRKGLVLVGMDTMAENLRRLLELDQLPLVLPAADKADIAQK